MNEFEFKQGIEQIEGAKAYAPPETLIVWCWGQFKMLDPKIWMEACRILTTYDKKARDFTNMDFSRAIQRVRDGIAREAVRKEYEAGRQSSQDRSPWRDKLLNAIDEAEGPEQRAFFEDVLRQHDAESGTQHDTEHDTERVTEPDTQCVAERDTKHVTERPEDYDEGEAGRIPF